MTGSYEIQAYDLLKQIIAIPSLSGEEELLARFLKKWLEKKGFLVQQYHNNLWVNSLVDKKLPTILLNSHMDTVKPVTAWTKDPFLPEETEEFIYGLGCSDAGGSLVSLIFAFIRLSEIKDRKYNLVLLISAEEENSGPNGISSAIEQIGKIDMAIVGEPTDLQMAICERGLLVLDCIARGKAAHVAHKDGVNAILNAIVDIEILNSLTFTKTSEFLGEVQLEVTQINAGYQHNVVPDECLFVVDVRTNELYTNEEVYEIIKGKISSDVNARSFRLKSSFIDPGHPFIKKAKELNIETFGSKTMSDQALIPAPSVKIGPGKSHLSHKADEHIEKLQIKEAIDLYYNLLKEFSL